MAVINSLNYIFNRFSCGQYIITFFGALFIPLGFGYMSRITHEVADGNEDGLPAHQVGTEVAKGMGNIIALVIYGIPNILLGTILANSFGTRTRDVFGNQIVEGNITSFVIALVVGLFFYFFWWVGYVRFSTTNNFMAYFEIPTNINILRQHFFYMLFYYVQLAVTWVILLILTVVLSFTFILICIPIFLIPFPILISGYVSGKMAQRFKVKVLDEDELDDVAAYFGGGIVEA